MNKYMLSGTPYMANLIEVSPWGDFQIDEPVMVRNWSAQEWNRRHFAGVDKQGMPTGWDAGLTSWSSEGDTDLRTAWNECRRPTPEELNAK